MTPDSPGHAQTSKLCNWLKQLYHWLGRARLFFLALGIGLGLPWLTLYAWPSEFHARFAGMLLQLGGIGTVAWGIRETRKIFGLPGIINAVIESIKNFPAGKPQVLNMPLVGDGPKVFAPQVHVDSSRVDLIDIEMRISSIEKDIAHIQNKISTVEEHFDSELIILSEELMREKQNREQHDKNLRKILEVTETGGLHISAMGAFWLFIGVILTSLPGEIAALFAR